MADSKIVVAGATGNLGGRIVEALAGQGARVTALVRPGTAAGRLVPLERLGARVAPVALADVSALAAECAGAACVVSALAGLREVIVDLQAGLLEAAVQAQVPRFIPSDYSIDFSKTAAGRNRNLDLRRELHRRLERAPIAATTVFNGAFAELLTGQMPLILFKRQRVLYWGDADQRLDFTTMDDTAAYTARAALDPDTPRFLRIAGDQPTARELAAIASEVTGRKFRLFRAGGLTTLGLLIKIARLLSPARQSLYPAWQGMQYMRDMFEGRAKLTPLDNARYPDLNWATTRELLAAHLAGQQQAPSSGSP